VVALPGLASVLRPDWNQPAFEEWVEAHSAAEYTVVPVGRRLKGNPPSTPEALAAKLVSALLPFGSEYPLPHFRRAECRSAHPKQSRFTRDYSSAHWK